MKITHFNDIVFYVMCFRKAIFLNLTPKFFFQKKIIFNCKPTLREHPFIV